MTAPRHRGLALALVVGGLAPLLNTTVVNIGLHSLQNEFHVSVSSVQWVSTAYLLALACVVPVMAWGQARFGSASLWIAALVIFLVGSVACALSPSFEFLIGARVVQGVGGGLVLPLMMSIVMRVARDGDLARLAFDVALATAAAPVIGPILGGLVLTQLGWRGVFVVTIPLCLAGVALALAFLPDDSSTVDRPRFDRFGFLLLAPALAGLLWALSSTHRFQGVALDDHVLVPLVGGALLLAAFVAWARRCEDPLVDVRLLGRRDFAWATVTMFFIGVAMFGVVFLLPLFWQKIAGHDPLVAGLLLIPQALGSLCARPATIALSQRWGAGRMVVVGFALLLLGTFPLAFTSVTTSPWILGVVLFVRGVGLGTVLMPAMAVAYVGMDRHDVPHATVIMRMAQQVGGAFGTAVLAVALGNAAMATSAMFDRAFWWAIGLTVVGLVASLFLPRATMDGLGAGPAPSSTDGKSG
ncbi:DHA2 family efflux MFS transporter permease subunit [Nocardioides zeae]|uniref:Multidrug efflux MFS transporter n=1 Tax=Nocardioides zeae TaxID=1457234 RepID=A0A6P0HLT2_9ACTN|nr:DHA2 family efflux MFS transporter permease subunit [Nocardioides zeae]NEN79556.1 multidrug efflux MFS transporter [Nocardioides zeae]